ncbi:hypothetical protein ACHAWF_016735, partial [Thalassiosira exigua]
LKNNVPHFSASTGLENKVYQWRGQQIRYSEAGPSQSTKTVLLIHGLFLNADHWRRTIHEFDNAGYRTYAIDLLGSGYSSKPNALSPEAKSLNGENGRFISDLDDDDENLGHVKQHPPIRENVVLGTEWGGRRVAKQLDLRHPMNSCYNFYTWAEQISDFTRDVIFQGEDGWATGLPKTTSLVGNSKGTVVALQALLDKPEYFNGVCTIDPTYREMHRAEMRFPEITLPMLSLFQKFLRSKGKGLYNIATQRICIENILKTPYENHAAIDDDLVTAMMNPLNLPNAAEVVFDEIYLHGCPRANRKPIWVCYGERDPWLSPRRVESLMTTPFNDGDTDAVVDKVIAIPNAGHCPHDERPEITNAIILDFLTTCQG